MSLVRLWRRTPARFAAIASQVSAILTISSCCMRACFLFDTLTVPVPSGVLAYGCSVKRPFFAGIFIMTFAVCVYIC